MWRYGRYGPFLQSDSGLMSVLVMPSQAVTFLSFFNSMGGRAEPVRTNHAAFVESQIANASAFKGLAEARTNTAGFCCEKRPAG